MCDCGNIKNVIGTEPDNIQIDEYTYELLDNVSPSQRFTTHLPVYPLRAACGYFDECGKLQDEDAEGWIDASGLGCTLNDKMFVVHAEGDSMEPKIHDGDLCVFAYTNAEEEGAIMLIESNKDDCQHVIKEYHSAKQQIDEFTTINNVTLHSLNPEFKDVELTEDNNPIPKQNKYNCKATNGIRIICQ